MAAAAPSPLASSVEKTNGAKLSRLLIDGGTTVLRTIFDHYHPPANLLAALNANLVTLNNLLRRRVFHRPQWDLLFPPGGATPDSNTFDITLLFLLLTNICGLSPPPSGWHACPPSSDTSFEGNLARIKYFRNELYGHVSTTGVDTPTFCALWLEISAVLVALGLDQAEIDRLKAERCGEEDYIDVLLEWANSEEDIKSQLDDIRQSQTKVQQTADEVRKSQLENRKILQEIKFKLEKGHQTQTGTQQTVDEVRKNQLEDHEILQESKGRLWESHQFQTITQQTIDKVRQGQLEDRKTIQEVYQIDREMHQVITDVRQTQIDERRAIQEICQNTEQGAAKLHEVRVTLRHTNSKVEEISSQRQIIELEQRNLKLEGKLEEQWIIQARSQKKITELEQRNLKLEEKLQEQRNMQEHRPGLPCYKMNSRPRGLCVLINNLNFQKKTKNGNGSQFDERGFKDLFSELSFTVLVLNDLSHDEMRKVAVDFSSKDHSQFDAFVLVVMSYGRDRDVIYGVDGRTTRVEDLMSEFKAPNCPTLRNKPKLFFIQTYRGTREDKTFSATTGNSCMDIYLPDSTMTKSVCPQEADFLLSFATGPCYVAWRNQQSGSLFVETLVEVIRKRHLHDHLLDMLTDVNRLVVERGQTATDRLGRIQVPAPVHTLRAKLYL